MHARFVANQNDMERKKVKIPDAILCSDFHLREDIPICRTDDYQAAQWRKVDFISDLQKKYDCPVYHAGDLFDNWKPSPNLLRLTLEHLPKWFCTVYGQHDLPQHNLDLVDKCGINVLVAANRLTVFPGLHYGQFAPADGSATIKGRKILVWHNLVYQRPPFPGATGGMAAGILRKYPSYDLILTGDNHQTFVEEFEGRLLINPGSMMRMDADQFVHRPSVFLWFAETNEVEQAFLPIEEDVITREHIEKIEQRDARIEAFISRLDGDWEAKVSFEENLKIFFSLNKIRDLVKNIVNKAIDF